MTTTGSKRVKTDRSIIADRINNVEPSGIRKFFGLSSSIEGIISLGVGEPDFVTPWHIREAAIHSIESGFTMYTANQGTPELRQALAGHFQSTYGLNYDPETQILITVGVSEGLDQKGVVAKRPPEDLLDLVQSVLVHVALCRAGTGAEAQVATAVPKALQADHEHRSRKRSS